MKLIAILCLILSTAILATPVAADEQCGPGMYGASPDARVPMTNCTPWPKPTYEEWLAGWRWAPPATQISTLPIRLIENTSTATGYGIEQCSLPGDVTKPGSCLGYNVPTVTLEYWCQRLRSLETATMRVDWAGLGPVCGQATGLVVYREGQRRGKVWSLARVR